MASNEDDDYMQDLKVRIYEKAEEGRIARVVRVEPRQSPSVPREVNVLHVLDAYFKFLGRRPRYYLVETRTGEWTAVVYVRGDIKGEYEDLSHQEDIHQAYGRDEGCRSNRTWTSDGPFADGDSGGGKFLVAD